MAVDSYLELFTTLFGWQWYGIVWEALSDTGIVYIPFVMIVINGWKDAARGGSYGNVHDLALRSVEIEFYVAVFVALIAGPPAVALGANTMSYTPSATLNAPTPVTATPALPDSSYGSAGAFSGAPGSVDIPVWWYAVLSLAKGINHAIIAGMPGSVGIREVQQQAQLATVSDPVVRAEAGQFYNDCYIPARSKYLRDKPTSAVITGLLTEYGADDPDWMGSHVLRALYYPSTRAATRVTGWPYKASRDVDYGSAATGGWGQPTCAEWWLGDGTSTGIRSKINALPEASALRNTLSSAATRFSTWLGPLGSSAAVVAEKLTDNAVRKSLSNSRVEAMTTFQPDSLGAYSGRNGVLTNLYGAAQDIAGTAGAGLTHFSLGTMLTALKPMLPTIQAITLMAVYALLPIIVVISGYSLSMLSVGAIGIFTINFWTVLWKFAQWVDENLTVAMHPGNLDGLMNWASSSGGVAGATSKALMLDTMLAAFMIGMPVLWTMVMGWAGISIGRSIQQSLSTSQKSTEQAGQAGGNMGSKTASKASGK
jgi:hypothetical protein